MAGIITTTLTPAMSKTAWIRRPNGSAKMMAIAPTPPITSGP